MSFLPVYAEETMKNDYLEHVHVNQTVKNSEYFSTAVYALDYIFVFFLYS